MEKTLRSALQTSAEEFLSAAVKYPLRSSKSSIKTLIYTLIDPSSELTSSLPFALRSSISRSISKFKKHSDSVSSESPVTPPAKRVRRSARNKDTDACPGQRGDNEMQPVAEKLQVYAYILHSCLLHPETVFSVSDLLPAAQELHDNLIVFESDSGLLSQIANLCEEWWNGNLLGKDNLISQSLPVFLARSLTLKKKVDVQRVYRLRDALLMFDFEDDSIEDLKNLLIRCVIAPLYLKTEDGRKFVVFTFGLSVQLTKEVCAMMKSQIPLGSKSVLEAYREIVFRAWMALEGECKYEIENGFLQGLIEGSIYASSGTLSASIRRIVGGFVDHRVTEGVVTLIFRLAEPVIFRSLQVANSSVRLNALHLLLDLFPLEDPDATKEAKDALLEKQFFLLEKLLMDECPDIRIVAVEGSCRILHQFWEVVPSPTIKKLIKIIFDDMANDACTEVRLSTIKGIMYLIDNPQSHEVLKVLLPTLGNLIMDSKSVIRAAITDLLLILNEKRNFSYHQVVSLEILLSTLADDEPLIARKITKILISSYFPSKVMEEEACKRCITLIRRNPRAGARFCEFVASEGASLRSLMKLFKVLIGLALSSVKLDKEHVEGLLVAASRLCTNLAADASCQVALKQELLPDRLKMLFSIASTARAQFSICDIISAASLVSIGDIFNDCMRLVANTRDLPDNTERQAQIRAVHKMILSCGWFGKMFKALTGLLQKVADECDVKFCVDLENQKTTSAKRAKIKSCRKGSFKKSSNVEKGFLDAYAVSVGVSWQINDLLRSENSRKAMLTSATLKDAYLALKAISEVSILHSQRYEYLSMYPVSAYTALALNMFLYDIWTGGSTDLTQATIADMTLDHLLKCSYHLFSEPLNSEGCHTGTKNIRITNMVKMLTSVLKFIVEVTNLRAGPCNQGQLLNFATESLKFIIANLREQSVAHLHFNEEDVRDIFICLRASFTYGAKLLNLVLKSCDVSESIAPVYGFANELFNLTVSIEGLLGYGYAGRFVTAVQQWLPDLILAFGSHSLLKQISEDGVCTDSTENVAFGFPLWLHILARTELCELTDADSEDETERTESAKYFPAFKRLVEMKTELLKANTQILDAVGVIYLTGARNALVSRNFDVFFGLLHYICVKLVRPEGRQWEGLKLMLVSLEELYAKLVEEAGNPDNSEDDRKQLYNAKALLEPVWISN